MGKNILLLTIALLILFPAQRAFSQSADTVRKMIIVKCWDQEREEPKRIACRETQLGYLKNYAKLLNAYPKDSRQYKTLVACSAKFPEEIMMWKLCASQEMPEEEGFKPFSLVKPGEPVYQIRLDPKAIQDQQIGTAPLIPFAANQSGSNQGKPAQSITNQGVYIPGGVRR